MRLEVTVLFLMYLEVTAENAKCAFWACGEPPNGCAYEANFRAIAWSREKAKHILAMVVLVFAIFGKDEILLSNF